MATQTWWKGERLVSWLKSGVGEEQTIQRGCVVEPRAVEVSGYQANTARAGGRFSGEGGRGSEQVWNCCHAGCTTVSHCCHLVRRKGGLSSP